MPGASWMSWRGGYLLLGSASGLSAPLSVNDAFGEAQVSASQLGSVGCIGRQKCVSRELWLNGCERLFSSVFWNTTWSYSSGVFRWAHTGNTVIRRPYGH